jgi:hypothetical protein
MGQPIEVPMSLLLPLRFSSSRLSSTACVWLEIRRDDIVVSFRLSVVGCLPGVNNTTYKAEQAPVGACWLDLILFYIFLYLPHERAKQKI